MLNLIRSLNKITKIDANNNGFFAANFSDTNLNHFFFTYFCIRYYRLRYKKNNSKK